MTYQELNNYLNNDSEIDIINELEEMIIENYEMIERNDMILDNTIEGEE